MKKNKHDIIDLTAEDIVAWYVADSETIQSMAEGNCGRRLSDEEMERMSCAFLENEEAFDSIMAGLITAIEDVMDNSNGRWDGFDAEKKRGDINS